MPAQRINRDSCYYEYSRNGYPVGCFSLHEHHGDYPYSLWSVVIHSKHRGQGWGRALMKCAITIAKRRGFPFLWLCVNADNVAARRLYESLGFCYVRPPQQRSAELIRRLEMRLPL
jgi:ribosomal protein S18 acetylase RimI-like enzyme